MSKKTLEYILKANAKQFDSSLSRSSAQAKKFQSTTKMAGKGASKAFGGVESSVLSLHKRMSTFRLGMSETTIGLTAAIAAAGTGAVALGRMADEMDRSGKTAQKLGLTTLEFTSLSHAVEQTANMTEQQFGMALQRMTRRISEAANGTGEAKDAIKELGLSAQQLEAMSPDMAFKLIADRMSKIPDQADRVRLSFKLFDSEGVNLVNTLQEGSHEIGRLQQEAIDLGVAFDDKAAASAEKFNDRLDVLNKTFKGTMMTMANESGVIDWLSKEFKELSEDIDTARKTAKALEDPYNRLSAQINQLRTRKLELSKVKTGIFGEEVDGETRRRELESVNKQLDVLVKKQKELFELRQKSSEQDKTVLPKVTAVGTAQANGDYYTMLNAQREDFGPDPFAAPSATGNYSQMVDGQTSVFDQETEKALSQVRTLEVVYGQALDRERMFRNERLDIVQNALDQEAISTERAAKLKNQIESQYRDANIKQVGEGFGTISLLMQTNSKEMFEIGKKAAIVQTTISTYQMAVESYKALAGIPYIGPVLGGAAAAASIAYGMSQVSAINSQNFTPSAEGGFDIPSGVNPVTQLHEKEMVLPKEQAEVIRNLSKNAGGNSGTPNVVIYNNGAKVQTGMENGMLKIFINQAAQMADSVIAKGIVDGTSQTGMAMERAYGMSR